MCKCVCFLLVSGPLPLCPGLSSSPTVCEFIHRKCRRALRVAGLMRSDVASPASRELSMSGRSARGKQTVDKIFNTALPVHGSNTSEKRPPSKIKKESSALPAAPPQSHVGLSKSEPCQRRPESGGNAAAQSSLWEDLWISTPPSARQGEESGLIERESSKVQRDLFQPMRRRVFEDAIGWKGAVLGFCLSDWGGG